VRPARKTVAACAIALAALVVPTACGGGGGGAEVEAPEGAGPTEEGATAATDTVTIDQFRFAPTPASAEAGSTLTVRNEDSTAHTFTVTDGPEELDTGSIAPGDEASLELSEAGEYDYRCSIHGSMRGRLLVS
jgi:plastocyanin